MNELETRRCEKAAQDFLARRRPPAHLRSQLDLRVRVTDESIEVIEIRSRFDNPQEFTETPVAKATRDRSQSVWKVYWQRADLKWHRYEPVPEVDHPEAFFRLVDQDENGCFFG